MESSLGHTESEVAANANAARALLSAETQDCCQRLLLSGMLGSFATADAHARARLRAGKPISALILGGSIEAGGDLNNRLDTYFAQVSDWLNDTFPPSEGQHTFHNGGRSSTGSPYFARCAMHAWSAHAPGGKSIKQLCQASHIHLK